MKSYLKGPLVYTKKDLQQGANNDGRIWAMYNKKVYDMCVIAILPVCLKD